MSDLARQMEMEDNGHTIPQMKEEPLKQRSWPFPLDFSDTDRDLTALQKLERFEHVVLDNILCEERIRQMQVTS